MSPNLITLIRVGLAFVSISLFRVGSYASVAALVLLVVALALDAVDGFVARRKRRASASSAFASARSPPTASSPVAPIHHMPGAPVTGVTCGLAPRKVAVARRISSSTTTWSHGRTGGRA